MAYGGLWRMWHCFNYQTHYIFDGLGLRELS